MAQNQTRQPGDAAQERRFSERTFALPFGRYQAGGESEDGVDEVLIGRSGQRSYFIELLLRVGRKGAFLVTGNRGVGKSSFVRHCLNEYQGEVFERFLRSRVGRAFFWDRALVLGLTLLFLLLALVLSEFVELIVLATSGDPTAGSGILLWMVIAPMALLCLYPLLFAGEVLTEVASALSRLSKGRASAERAGLLGGVGFVVLLSLSFVAWRLGPFGAPAVGASRLLVALGALYLWGESFSFCRRLEGPGEGWRRPRLWYAATFAWTAGTAAFVLFGGEGLLWKAPLAPQRLMQWNLASALFLVGLGGGVRGGFQALRWRAGRQRASLGVWYLGPGILLAGVSLVYLLASASALPAAWVALAIPVAVALCSFACFGGDAGKRFRWTPSPALALGWKAFLSIVVSLQLLHPILASSRGIRLVDGDLKREIQAVQGLGERGEAAAGGQVAPGRGLRSPLSLFEVSGRNHGSKESRCSLFHGRDEELFWVLGIFLSLGVLYLLDSEWVVKPFLRERQDGAIDPAGVLMPAAPPAAPAAPERADLRHTYRNLARLTLPWMVYRLWLPVIVVSVNLGFEGLHHRQVVQAMLTGLRAQYHRTFLAWNSALANLGRLLGIVILLLMVSLVGGRWFSMPQFPKGMEREAVAFAKEAGAPDYQKICDYFAGRQKGPGAVNLICKLRWGDSVFHFLYYDFVQGGTSKIFQPGEKHLLFYLLPNVPDEWPGRGQPTLLEAGLHFRVYHLILLILFFFIGRAVLFKLPILPYREVLKRIDEVLENLTASTSTTSRIGRLPTVQWIEGFLTDERVRQTQRDPFDPRTIEFLFLRILEEIQNASLPLPGVRNQWLSLPVPEITFVLDELDKLGTRVEPSEEGKSVGVAEELEILHGERRRSQQLHDLLADMKNLLSSAPARFIFVGGRNLHDEWLADQNARQPLLTNIFNAEVYLPSLMADHSRRERRHSGWLSQKVEAYLHRQIERGHRLQTSFARKLAIPSLALPVGRPAQESFLDPDQEIQPGRLIKFLDSRTGDPFPGEELGRDFVQFLTYRTTGNPKRLNELLRMFIRPLGRVVRDRQVGADFACEHVLALEEADRFRIQLVAGIFRQLESLFELGFARRDDKMIASVFYLSDFLFKFHRRAFSWSNLERVEDMVHIHRAPDVRDVLGAMVVQWSETFFHRIRNGMYDFRFRSELAREVEHISRQSPEEMAAFNFTLDESQALKAVYEANLRRFGDTNSRQLQGMVAGLGELHEFDQEYETARFYYRKAISLLDDELETVVGNSVLDSESPMIDIIGGVAKGQKNARLYLSWGISRLRLMLQVGMTFELSRNLEQAQVEYQDAHTLARSLLLSLLDQDGREVADEPDFAVKEKGGDRLHILKHLNLLFQPVFAEVWVSEKLEGAVDSSITLAKKELCELHRLLPFVRDPWTDSEIVGVRHSSFALIMSELHGKLGDLFFYKGRQAVRLEHVGDTIENAKKMEGKPVESLRQGSEGYLLRAHYHYGVALHMLRRFVTYRFRSSPHKLNIWSEQKWPTISPQGWPDFVYRAVGGTFNDFAEVMLGRVSLLALFANLSRLKVERVEEAPQDRDAIFKACTEWMELALNESKTKERREAGEAFEIDINLGAGAILHAATLESWIGRWGGKVPEKPDDLLIEYESREGHGDLARLAVAVNLMLVGAKYQEKGGYLEQSARELLKVCETVTHYLWWAVAVKRLIEWRGGTLANRLNSEFLEKATELWDQSFHHIYWAYLLELGVYALEKAARLFLRSRRSHEEDFPVGSRIPVVVLDTACSLQLLASHWSERCGAGKETLEMATVWHAADDVQRRSLRLLTSWRARGSEEETAAVLERALVRHSYPMIHRLHGLKILIDDEILGTGEIWAAGSKALDRTEELLDLAASLNAPLHFPPLHLGVTCALVYLSSPDYPADRVRVEKIRRAAQRNLARSEEMSTMRLAHYESIGNLYYLYDDFNDRQAHFSHAIQMAGLELVALLRYLVDRPDKDSSSR